MARGEWRARQMFPLLLSLGELSPVVVPNALPTVFWVAGRIRGSGFAAIVLRDVAPRPRMETAPAVPPTGAERSDPVFEEGDGPFEPFFQADARFPVEP